MEVTATEYLMNIRRTIRLHEMMLKEVCMDYGLTLIEANIISFLHNNPGRDTAGDIVELRMLSKGNVSKAVELLIGKKLLERRPDAEDRRKIHLLLLPSSEAITKSIDEAKEKLFEEICCGFSEEEMEQLITLSTRTRDNIVRAIKKRTGQERKDD